jgi:hypothetical protein
MADIISPGRKPASFQKPANDNESCSEGMRAIVMIPEDFPIIQVEIEILAALLNDRTWIPANDNVDPEI